MPLITVEEHLAAVRERFAPLPASVVPLASALGGVLAEAVTAAHDLPTFDNSSMDGYAIRHADAAGASDTPVTLEVVADLPAGSADDPPLGPGQAARIMTGAPVPSDADAIVPLEDTDRGTEQVRISFAPNPGAFIRRAGDEVRAGDTIVEAGTRLEPWHLAAIAATGNGTVAVHQSPRVAIIATGSELVAPGDPLARGQISESNTVLLRALVERDGGTVERVAVVADDETELQTELDACDGLDLVILSGGVSVGAYDIVKSLLQPTGTVEFVTVAMQPGKPQAFGELASGVPVFGLPGNPVSVAVSYEVFVRDAIVRMQGADPARTTVTAVSEAGWRTPPNRRQYLPVVATLTDAGWRIRPVSSGGSHLIASLARADAFAVIPADTDEVRAGDTVTVILAGS